MSQTPILRIAIPSPLRRSFDYLPPEQGGAGLQPGIRIRVPFGKRIVIGVLLELAKESAVPAQRLKRVIEVLDKEPVLPSDLLALLNWGSNYYHHPIGEVIAGALPALLREGRPARLSRNYIWQLTESGKTIAAKGLTRAPRQQALLSMLKKLPSGLHERQINQHQQNWRPVMYKLAEKNWVQRIEAPILPAPAAGNSPATSKRLLLNKAQQAAVDTVLDTAGRFSVSLLDGVTGSGKTEVYLQIIEQIVDSGRQAMVLVPEIGLTPQLLERFLQRFPHPVALLHSSLSNQERLAAWLSSRSGEAAIIIGTRSALFTPVKKLGVIIVDEEHDTSFKQQEGFRYSARDMAIIRARNAGVPIILGSATPSLESLYNAQQKRYLHLSLPERAGEAKPPAFRLLDLRHQPLQEGLAPKLLDIMEAHLQTEGQILLFLNRRGFAPTLLCHECGWVGRCHRCDTHLTFHQLERRLRCHHCGSERPVDPRCPDCGSIDLRALGTGTERIEQALQHHFPGIGIARLDRDSTRRKGSMQTVLNEIQQGHKRILIGTQMLAKGHHFPNVTLVGILDTDQGLFSADFRASERMSQLITQVAGRAGRAEKPGLVVIQTHHPDHPLLQQLITHGYQQFATAALQERQEAELPPYCSIALLRAEAPAADTPTDFLYQALQTAERLHSGEVSLLGPVPAPMEKRAGRYRAQLLLQSTSRAALHHLLSQWMPQLETLKSGRKVRWSLDVDPVDLF